MFGRAVLIPASVVLSVMFGGSYASGREIVEFVSRHGQIGGFVAILTIIVCFAAIGFLTFELARLHQAHDYRSLLKVLLGRAWFVYEIAFLVGLATGLALISTVAGTVLNDYFGIPVWVGILMMFTFVVTLNYLGRGAIEHSMILSVAALVLVVGALLFFYLGWRDGQPIAGPSQVPTGSAIRSGLIYAIFSASYLPLLLFGVSDLRSRGESMLAAISCAVALALPGVVFHFVFMSQYPAIIERELPAYFMYELVSPAWMVNIYIVVLFVLISQTGVGFLQGFIERMDNWSMETNGRPLPRYGHALISAAMLIASLLLGSVGIIALILGAFTYLSATFLFIYILPLMTRGIWLVSRSPNPEVRG